MVLDEYLEQLMKPEILQMLERDRVRECRARRGQAVRIARCVDVEMESLFRCDVAGRSVGARVSLRKVVKDHEEQKRSIKV